MARAADDAEVVRLVFLGDADLAEAAERRIGRRHVGVDLDEGLDIGEAQDRRQR